MQELLPKLLHLLSWQRSCGSGLAGANVLAGWQEIGGEKRTDVPKRSVVRRSNAQVRFGNHFAVNPVNRALVVPQIAYLRP